MKGEIIPWKQPPQPQFSRNGLQHSMLVPPQLLSSKPIGTSPTGDSASETRLPKKKQTAEK